MRRHVLFGWPLDLVLRVAMETPKIVTDGKAGVTAEAESVREGYAAVRPSRRGATQYKTCISDEPTPSLLR